MMFNTNILFMHAFAEVLESRQFRPLSAVVERACMRIRLVSWLAPMDTQSWKLLNKLGCTVARIHAGSAAHAFTTRDPVMLMRDCVETMQSLYTPQQVTQFHCNRPRFTKRFATLPKTTAVDVESSLLFCRSYEELSSVHY
jgi:hypothetical protein